MVLYLKWIEFGTADFIQMYDLCLIYKILTIWMCCRYYARGCDCHNCSQPNRFYHLYKIPANPHCWTYTFYNYLHNPYRLSKKRCLAGLDQKIAQQVVQVFVIQPSRQIPLPAVFRLSFFFSIIYIISSIRTSHCFSLNMQSDQEQSKNTSDFVSTWLVVFLDQRIKLNFRAVKWSNFFRTFEVPFKKNCQSIEGISQNRLFCS
jgi:hypothetical protein